MSLADVLERAAEALPSEAGTIRPANGDPYALLQGLDADGRIRLLEWLLGEAPGEADELLADWLDEPGGVAAVEALDESRLAKPGRKVLRRARHALRSRGVELAERPAAARVARLPQVADDLTAAWISGLDGRGSGLVFLVEPHPAGGARLFEALLDDARGVLDFQVFNAGRRKVRGFVKDMLARPGFEAVAVDPGLARARILAVAERHPADRPLPPSVSEWAHRFRPQAGDAPGAVVEKALEPAERGEALARVVERVRSGDLGPWPVATEVLSGVAARLRESSESGLVVSEATRAERAGELLADEALTVYAGEAAGIAATRFRETAFVDWRSGREAEARDCLAVALAFDESTEAARPVAVAMLEGALSGVLDALAQEAAGDTAEPTDAGGAPSEDRRGGASEGDAHLAEK